MIIQEKNNKDDDFVIDIVGVYNIFWASRKFIISFVSLAAIISVMIALSLPIVYKSSAKIFPNNASVNQSSIASQFGGIASLAGIQLGQTSSTEVTLALETMRSYKFFEENLYGSILPELSAMKDWSSETGIIFDEEIYDVESQTWVNGKPSSQQAFRSYSSHVEIVEDQISKIITVTVLHGSPLVAKKWIDLIIMNINDISKNEEIEKATKAIDYFEKKMGSSTLISVTDMFAKLTEDQHKRLMLAEIEDEFMFRTIEPALVPEMRFKPSRAKFCILFTLISGVLSLIIVFIKDFIKRNAN